MNAGNFFVKIIMYKINRLKKLKHRVQGKSTISITILTGGIVA